MLFLYYTNSDEFNKPQDRPDRSVGGFMSSSPIPNDQLGNLFSSLDLITLNEGVTQTRGIGIKNEAEQTLTNLKAWIVAPESPLAEFEIAFVAVSKNDCNESYMEKLINGSAAPYYATFYKPAVDSKLSVGVDIQPGQYLGMWIKRSIPSSSQKQKSCDQIYDDYINEVEVDTQEQLIVNFEWDYIT